MSKKVIFIGGTSYSGSTFFDMTLGNDPLGFSLGEINAYFNPWREHHFHPRCSCGFPDCDLWVQWRGIPQEDIYKAVFERFPNLEFIVDSSKDPLWIQRQAASLSQQGLDARHILMWKTPLEFGHSFRKRNRIGSWYRHWINYHRLYMTLVPRWGSIQYRHYAEGQESLSQICGYLDIPYFRGKEKFWEKPHHLIFGNNSARVHLGTDNKASRTHDEDDGGSHSVSHQTIYYRPIKDKLLENHVAEVSRKSAHISYILAVLAARDIHGDGSLDGRGDVASLLSLISMSPASISVRKFKIGMRTLIGRLRYGALQ